MKHKQDKGDQQLEQAGQVITTFFKSVWAGLKACWTSRLSMFFFLGIVFFSYMVFRFREEVVATFLPDYAGAHVLKIAVYAVSLLPVLYLCIIGSSEGVADDKFQQMFKQIRFCGKGGVYPKYKYQTKEDKKVIYAFHAPGLPLEDWKNNIAPLESAFNCNILKITNAPKSKQTILLHTVPAEIEVASLLPWREDFILKKDFELCVGEALLDQVVFDLNKYPHALIAGVTGSGKSVTLRCMLWQCIKKGARPYMIDFKGGVEFGIEFEQFGEVVTDHNEALELLKELKREQTLRLQMFRETGVKKLPEYNKKFPDLELSRITVFVDEVAEMLDKEGLSRQEKAIYYEIEQEMSSLARLGRAAGINMIMGTQRPDAKVIKGQIKNNLPIRISGRMVDKQASEMVLGNTKASSLDDTLGRFMYTVGSDTVMFQAYNFPDILTPGNYQRGRLLIESEPEASVPSKDMRSRAAGAVSPEIWEDEDDQWFLRGSGKKEEEMDDYEGF